MLDQAEVAAFRNGDAETIKKLIERYTSFSKVIANDILKNYKRMPSYIFDEIVDIGLQCLCLAIKKYKGEGPLAPFWKKIFKNQLVKDFFGSSYIRGVLSSRTQSMSSLPADASITFASSDDIMYDIIAADIADILNKSGQKYREKDIQICELYFAGFKIGEISSELNMSSSTVSRRIKRIIQIITDTIIQR